MTDWMGFGLLILVLVFHTVESEPDRQVVNTTCLELAKLSNQPLRLSCGTPDHYHCLLDETYTREYEVCRAWKWIPGGKCAYFNTYGQGNVDERMCTPLPNLACSTAENQFKSSTNTQYTACYEKKATTAAVPTTTSSSPLTWTSERENSTSSSDLEIIHMTSQRLIPVLASVTGVLVPFLILFGIYFVFRHSKCLDDDLESNARKDAASLKEMEHLISSENNDRVPQKSDTNDTSHCEHAEDHFEDALDYVSNSSSALGTTKAQNDKSVSIEVRTTKGESPFENTSDMCHTEKTDNDVKEDERKSTNSSSYEKDGNYTNTMNPGNVHANVKESVEVCGDTRNSLLGEVTTTIDDPDNGYESDNKVFNDTTESLQREATSIDEQEVKHCQELFGLLDNEGRDLIQEVLRLVFTSTDEKTPEDLLADEEVKSKLKTVLPEESQHFLTDHTSIHVLYGLIQLYSGKEPKSGWGKPVKGCDTGIGDDVERLYRIFRIHEGISNAVAVSVENYARLFDILLPALTRLDSDGESKDSDGKSKNSGGVLKEKYMVLADKLKAIINPTWKQSVHKAINNFVQQWSPWKQ